MKKLCVLILQYNSSDMTLQLLESLEKQEGPNLPSYRIIFMDNASEDPKKEEITKKHPYVEFVQFEENLGFAKAHNVIWDRITEEWTLLINNDCILTNDAINQTLSQAKKNSADFATCSLLNKDGSPQIHFSSGLAPIKNILVNCTGIDRLFIQKIRLKRKKSRIGFCSGAFLLINTELFRQVGMFDDKFFMYAEDIDLMIRLRKAGAKGYLFTSGKVIHLEAGSAARKWDNKEIARLKMRRTMDVYESHYPRWQVRLWFRAASLAATTFSYFFDIPENSYVSDILAFKEEFRERAQKK